LNTKIYSLEKKIKETQMKIEEHNQAQGEEKKKEKK
jgi:hypothetical protein